MLRFQPSWILQSFGNDKIENLYFPYAPRAESLLWFKRVGHGLIVHDPVPVGQVGLSAVLANDSEQLAEAHRRLATRAISKPVALELNPFRSWLDKPFSREQLDHLFFWREAGFELEPLSQRCLFMQAVGEVIHCLCGFEGVSEPRPMPPDELMGYFLKQQQQRIFARKGNVRIFDSVERAAANLDAFCALVLPLLTTEPPTKGYFAEEYFHAWLNGDGDLERARSEMHRLREPVCIDWKGAMQVERLVPLAKGCCEAVIAWSGDHLPPQWYDEQLVRPLKAAFASTYQKMDWYVKGADRQEDAYDFLLVMK